MNITLIFFSQTGNTRRVARSMAEAFQQSGHQVRMLPLKKADPEDILSTDLLGIGSACYSSQAPTPIKNFLQGLPPLPKLPAFVFATCGGSPGRVLYDLASLLRKKDAVVMGGFVTRGSVYHPVPCLFGRFPNRPNPEDLAEAREFALRLSAHVSTGSVDILAGIRADALKPGMGFYDMVAAVSTDRFLRVIMPEPKVEPLLCNQCG